MNESDLEYLNYETGTTPPVKVVAGKEFIHARIEVISDAGNYSLGGISIGYDATQTVTATAFDDIVMSINRARLDSSKSSNLPMKFTADSTCSLKVSLISITTSGDIAMGAMTWKNDSQTLTPSQLWREVNTRALRLMPPHLIVSLSICIQRTTLRCGLFRYSDKESSEQATMNYWSSPMMQYPKNVTNGIHDLNTRFRTSQAFDDQSNLRLEIRIELANGIVSMPSIRHWSNSAVENNLMIKSVLYQTDRGQVNTDLDYLMADDNLSIHVKTGFENGLVNEKPYPGEYELRLNRNNETIANTTGYEGTEGLSKPKLLSRAGKSPMKSN